MSMNRHETRIKVVTAVYQHLLLNKDMVEAFIDNFENIDEYVGSIENDLIAHEDAYIETISNNLNKWTFDRLSYIDQAILLVGTSEYNLNKDNKKIIIDEAVRIAKEYSDDDSYKYINGVLDNL